MSSKSYARKSSKTTKKQTLSDLIKIAITQNDFEQLLKLKDICNEMHQNGKPYQNYNPEDLPTDTLYEELTRKITDMSKAIATQMNKGIPSSDYVRDGHVISTSTKYIRRDNAISDVWMGSVVKRLDIPIIKDAILMPKFDGCSCCARFSRVDDKFILDCAVTRGQEVGNEIRKSDIKNKFLDISSHILTTLNENTTSLITPSLSISDIKTITFRGEIVLTDKSVAPVPASYIAGKINGGQEVWDNALENIIYIPFEITRIITSTDETIIPTQNESIQFFTHNDLFPVSAIYKDLSKMTPASFERLFEKIQKSIPYPIDGIVYCSREWTYPQDKSQTTDATYGKYAWKPSSEVTTKLEKIQYNISRDGKLGAILHFSPTEINGKKYKQAKCSISSLRNELSGISLNDPITVKLCHDITPHVESYTSYQSSQTKAIKLPTKCPFCDSTLIAQSKGTKSPIHTLTCTNLYCPERRYICFKNLFKTLHIQGVAEKRIKAIPNFNIELLDETYHINFFDKCNSTTLEQFLTGCGLASAPKVKKMINEYNSIQTHAAQKLCLTASPTSQINKLMTYLDFAEIDDSFILEICQYLHTISKQ